MLDWTSENLHDIHDAIWSAMRSGAEDPHSPFHWPVLATVATDAARLTEPAQRMVVLREADRRAGSLQCRTDRRSDKVAQIQTRPIASWYFYDRDEMVQIAMSGDARLHIDDAVARMAWEDMPTRQRMVYCIQHPPGTRAERPTSDLPPSLEQNPNPGPVQVAHGESNVAVLVSRIHRITWFRVGENGNRRADFERVGEQFRGHWSVP